MEQLENLRKAASVLLGKEVEAVAYRRAVYPTDSFMLYIAKFNGDVMSPELVGKGGTPGAAYDELRKNIVAMAQQQRDKAISTLDSIKDLLGPEE